MIKKFDKAPLFTLLDANGDEVSLASFQGQKVILYFYPKDHTPGCTAQACSFRDYNAELQALGYVVLGISKDTVGTHKNFMLKHDLPFTLLADPTLDVIKRYGMLKEKTMFGRKVMGTSRSTVIIDENGVITDIFNNVKARTSTGELVEFLRQKSTKI